jgi:hypothetical protein
MVEQVIWSMGLSEVLAKKPPDRLPQVPDELLILAVCIPHISDPSERWGGYVIVSRHFLNDTF